MNSQIATKEILSVEEVMLSRKTTRDLAAELGFDELDQARLGSAVFGLVLSAYEHAGSGRVEFSLEEGKLVVKVIAGAKGTNPKETPCRSIAAAILAVKRLMEPLRIEANETGTRVVLEKSLPEGAPVLDGERLAKVTEKVDGQATPISELEELKEQDRVLVSALWELDKREKQLSELNRELEATNRGVVALHAELEQRADFLRRVSESKTRFFSNMTHEFRTPLNSIISISRMLADRLDGELTPEQEKQVGFIRNAAADLAHLVDDLLDLAKVEAGKAVVHAEPFLLQELFNALRGTLRPLLEINSKVNLVFADAGKVELCTDEAKLSQILRNFISNALKYTIQGEVRVGAQLDGADHIIITVSDTGVGIAPENLARIFEEFEQVEGPHQLKVKGTGLGLPLAKSLADLLGGRVGVSSKVGVGSKFWVRLPLRHEESQKVEQKITLPSQFRKVLVIDDDEASRYILRNLLEEASFEMVEASTAEAGLELACASRPDLILLDLGLPDKDGREVLKQLKNQELTQSIPVIIHTSQPLTEEEKRNLKSMAAGLLRKDLGEPGTVLKQMLELLGER